MITYLLCGLFLKHPYKRFCFFIFFIFTSRDLCLCLCLSVSLSLCLSLSHTHTLSICLSSPSISFSFSFHISFSNCLSLSVCHILYLYTPLKLLFPTSTTPIFLSQPLSVSFPLSQSLSLILSLSHPLYLYFYICPPLSASDVVNFGYATDFFPQIMRYISLYCVKRCTILTLPTQRKCQEHCIYSV